MWLYLPLAFIAVCYFVYWFITRKFNYWKDRNISYPEPVPLFGNIKDSALRRIFIGTIYKEIYDKFPNEKVVGTFRMTEPCLLLRDPDIIKLIMIKDFDLFADRGVEFSKDGLGANLFHADDDTWRVLRTKFSPIFSSGKLKNMFHLITERGDRFLDYMDEQSKNQSEHNIHSAARMYTMSTITACAFGLDLDYKDPSMAMLYKMDQLVLENKYRTQEIDFMFPGILKVFQGSLFPAEINNFFHDLVRTVFSQRNGKPSNRKDFMDLIIEMKQQKVIHSQKMINDANIDLELTDSIIAAQAFVFYVAGFETSSTTVAFLLYELTQNPHIQDKLIEEIDDVLKKCRGELDYDILMDMPYMTKVFDETLRKYPIVDPLVRRAKVDYKIPGTDVTIEKGQYVTVTAMGLHHDEKYFPNPNKFDPERFSAENSKDRHSCAYLPFGTGPRNCIGLRFAKVQSRVFLVKLLSRFKVEASPNTPEKVQFAGNRIILGPAHGIPLNLVHRNK